MKSTRHIEYVNCWSSSYDPNIKKDLIIQHKTFFIVATRTDTLRQKASVY